MNVTGRGSNLYGISAFDFTGLDVTSCCYRDGVTCNQGVCRRSSRRRYAQVRARCNRARRERADVDMDVTVCTDVTDYASTICNIHVACAVKRAWKARAIPTVVVSPCWR